MSVEKLVDNWTKLSTDADKLVWDTMRFFDNMYDEGDGREGAQQAAPRILITLPFHGDRRSGG